jgi:hypothetical protein
MVDNMYNIVTYSSIAQFGATMIELIAQLCMTVIFAWYVLIEWIWIGKLVSLIHIMIFLLQLNLY